MSIQVVAWVLEESDAEGGARLVLLALANHAHSDFTKAFPSVRTIAHEARMSTRSAQYNLRRLEADGRILRTGVTRSGTTIYQIVKEPGPEGGANLAGVQPTAPGGAQPASPEPSDEPSGGDPSGLPSGGQAAEPEPVEAVWQRYRQHKPKMPGRLDRERREVIRRALKVATVEECCKAIDGCFASPFHQGDNETGKKYDALSTILRGRAGKETTRERIEFFMGFLDARPRRSGAPAQDVTLGLRDRSHWRLGRKTPRGPDA